METTVNDCWNKIGIVGDRSCQQLKTVIHCRNCSEYSTAGRALFEREAPPGYLEEWTNLLTQSLTEKSSLQQQSTTSVIIFRLEQEWFALPIEVIKEVTQICPVHRLPHRSGHILRGIVNIRGEILTCVSLNNLLGLTFINSKKRESSGKIKLSPVIYQRMIVMEIQENRWVFSVDELDSVHRFSADAFHDSPAALSKTPDTYTKKIITWYDTKVNFLDYELLFYELLFHTYSRPQ